jgi:hypothetical protein
MGWNDWGGNEEGRSHERTGMEGRHAGPEKQQRPLGSSLVSHGWRSFES